VAGARRVVLNVAAQAHDEIIDGARVGVFAQSPHLLQHAFSRDGGAFVVNQEAQDAGFHHCQWVNLAARPHFQKIEVDGFVAEDKRVFDKGPGTLGRRRSGTQPLLSPQQTPDPCDQNREFKGFR